MLITVKHKNIIPVKDWETTFNFYLQKNEALFGAALAKPEHKSTKHSAHKGK